MQRINTSKEDELSQCHLVENKRLPKIMKNEGKTRALMFKQSLRISIVGLTADQEKERIKQVVYFIYEKINLFFLGNVMECYWFCVILIFMYVFHVTFKIYKIRPNKFRNNVDVDVLN